MAVQNNELMFPSNTRSSSHKNLDRYSYHVYGGTGYFYGVIYLSVKTQVLRKALDTPRSHTPICSATAPCEY